MTQTLLFKGQAANMIMSAPDQTIFKRPMSYGARDTLAAMLEWGAKHTNLFGHNPRALMAEFCKRFNPIVYEEAEQSYQMEHYVKAITGSPGVKSRPGFKPKTQEDVLSAMLLDKLFNKQWAHDSSIPSRSRIGDITQCVELYNWLTSSYLLSDFPSIDLGKISEMGRTCKVDAVKREAQQIADPTKHTIPYLYAIIRGLASRDEISKHREQTVNTENLKKLAQLGDLAMGVKHKIAHTFDPDQREKWETERAFTDLLRSLDKE